ncbi:MAG: T9SS type A sorting domain-containing protein, partial [Cytophagales bacterium]|nr:T9SS type A sorting domain-containing protein [Cytophagales bacterium]
QSESSEIISEKLTFPNPFSDEINFVKPAEVEVYNAKGLLIFKDEKVDKIKTNDWIPGIYTIKRSSNGGFKIEKLIKL